MTTTAQRRRAEDERQRRWKDRMKFYMECMKIIAAAIVLAGAIFSAAVAVSIKVSGEISEVIKAFAPLVRVIPTTAKEIGK